MTRVTCPVLPVVVTLLVAPAGRGFARQCGDGAGDEAAVAAARAQVENDCPCAAFTEHGAYVRCAAGVARRRSRDGLLPRACTGRVKRCAARSTCGKPGFVTCCRSDAVGATSCHTSSDASSCRARPGGSACVGSFASCCDACGSSGCASTTTSIATTSSTTATTGPSTTTTLRGPCHYDSAARKCIGTCAPAGGTCVPESPGTCVCGTPVCSQCFLTIGLNMCVSRLCSANDRCALPNEYCFMGCPTVECPCCPVCGDGVCVADDETPCSCPADCGPGTCDPRATTCGDGLCDRTGTPGESHENCPQDCPFACREC